jgi:fluoroacetyl-CoA thioesterase
VSFPSELELTWPVDRTLCTERGGAHLLSTPSLVLLMERTAVRLLEPRLGQNETTVGTEIRVSHLAPTPEGSTVRIRATIEGQEGRFTTFRIDAFDELEQVGTAEHRRAVVDVARYTARLQSKLERLHNDDRSSPP